VTTSSAMCGVISVSSELPKPSGPQVNTGRNMTFRTRSRPGALSNVVGSHLTTGAGRFEGGQRELEHGFAGRPVQARLGAGLQFSMKSCVAAMKLSCQSTFCTGTAVGLAILEEHQLRQVNCSGGVTVDKEDALIANHSMRSSSA